MNAPPDHQKENPDSLAGETGVQGIEALPNRVERYSKAKSQALDVANYMAGIPKHQAMSNTVRGCGDYLVFRHYFTVDKVRLHGASLCRKHLLCPICAIRRGAKSLAAYLQRWEVIKAEKPLLRPFLVTLTVKDGPDLAERFQHLMKSQRELWKRTHRCRVHSPLSGVDGAVWSYEIKRGSGSGEWHPHLHMIALAEDMQLEGKNNPGPLGAEWKRITGDSHMVDVRPIDEDDPVSGFIEVFKYAVKFSDQPPEDTVHAWETLAGKRLLGSAGCFRGVEVPEGLMDDLEGLNGLPYIQLFYRYLVGRGYDLANTSKGIETPAKKRPAFVGPPKPLEESRLLHSVVFDRLLRERLTIDRLPGGYAVGMQRSDN